MKVREFLRAWEPLNEDERHVRSLARKVMEGLGGSSNQLNSLALHFYNSVSSGTAKRKLIGL